MVTNTSDFEDVCKRLEVSVNKVKNHGDIESTITDCFDVYYTGWIKQQKIRKDKETKQIITREENTMVQTKKVENKPNFVKVKKLKISLLIDVETEGILCGIQKLKGQDFNKIVAESIKDTFEDLSEGDRQIVISQGKINLEIRKEARKERKRRKIINENSYV